MDQMDRLRRVVDARKEGEGRAYREASRRRLARVAERKCKTSFIGAIAAFEEAFGAELWGHGKPFEQLSPAERAAYQKWQECRTRILNGGNSQVRALHAELEEYEITWNRYHAELTPGPAVGPEPPPA